MHARTWALGVFVSALVAAPTAAADPPVYAERPEAPAARRDPAAEAAYAEGLALFAERRFTDAVAQFDLAAEREPAWSEPVRARAEAFGALADRYHPSEAFLAARAADLQRLLALEPGEDVAARQQEIAELQRRRDVARRIEERRRKLIAPALLTPTISAGLILAGGMLSSIRSDEFLRPASSHRSSHRNVVGLEMLVAGVALVPPALVFGALAGQQVRHDSVSRDFAVQTGRPRPSFALRPRLVPGGGGVGLSLRF